MKHYKSNVPELALKKIPSNISKVKIQSSADAAEYARNFYHDDLTIYESFFLVMLNNANNTTGFVKISQGGIASTIVDIRVLAKYAIESLSPAVILVHNHPSGKLAPSNADRQITKKIVDTLAIFDCKVLDHIILTEDSYTSFADEGYL